MDEIDIVDPVQSAAKFPPAPEYSAPPQYPIESVDNALRLLLLVGERRSIRLTDASTYLKVASSTAHRLLAMLTYRGFLAQNPQTRVYEAGPTLDRVATSVLRRQDVREQARPILERLAMETGETIHLGRLEGREVHFLDSVESSRAVRVGSRLGRFMPAHCTSTGKAMLATMSDDQLRDLYPQDDLEQLTPKSIGTFGELMKEIEKIRRVGHAVSVEESEEGVSSLAMALSSRNMPRPIAVNVSSPTSRTGAADRKRNLAFLRKAVEDIEALVL